MNKILITGGCGFIGTHTFFQGGKRGYQILSVDLKNKNNYPYNKKVDILDPQLGGVFRSFKPDYVIHLAAQTNLRHSITDPIYDAQTNIMGSLNVIKYCLENQVKKLIFASTGGAIYQDSAKRPWTEQSPTQPASPYGISKLTTENYLKCMKLLHNLDYVALRFSNVYGFGQDASKECGVIAIFTELLKQNKPLAVFGTGQQTRDYVHVSDVVEAIYLAIEKPICGTFNVSTNVETSINDLLTLMKVTEQVKYQDPIPGELQHSVLSYDKFHQATGWSPKVDLKNGLRTII